MTTIELFFRAGRYHATPWGRHVNEGVAEWPPSPYRLLRALYDVWQRKCPHFQEESVANALAALGSCNPDFHLPKAVASHTRSYLNSNTEDPSAKSLIFDGFVAVAPEEPCVISWPTDVNAAQSSVLRELLDNLNFLGRSESWIEARLVERASRDMNCRPVGVDDRSDSTEIVDVACPAAPSVFSSKSQWLNALTYSTTQLVKDRRSGPPAMRQVPYSRPRDAVATWLRPAAPSRALNISLIELSLHSKVLPLATETLRIAEVVRSALMKQAGEKSLRFSGRNDAGPLKDGHKHTFYLPQFDRLDRIDKVLLVLTEGAFEPADIDAALRLQRLYLFGEEPMRVTLTRAGSADERCPARTVVSATPYVPARYWRAGRGSWNDFVVADIHGECEHHNLPRPILVAPPERKRSRFEPVHFRRSRKEDSPRRGEFVEIEFPSDVKVPFSLGYGCHFGLGQFVGK